MVRKKEERKLDVKNMFGGAGEAKLLHILNTNDEMYNKGRVFTQVTLEPGCEIGWHIHHGDGETYCILKGQGEYSDNGNIVTVNPGDVTFVGDGEGHSLKNIGTEPLEAVALILFK
jgi:mannose-6-phosphate isomerase-like protein (cupin superfamily)